MWPQPFPLRAANFFRSCSGVTEEVITHSAEETTRWGREFAKRLKPPVLVLLTGDLGSGKTTLTKGIVAGLGAAKEDEVTSPTFTLVHVYGGANKVYHGDLYRIETFHDFETLGLEDVFANPAVVILEWSERFPLPSPWPQLRLRLEHQGGDTRRITVSAQ
jgi:tRNA threonylcarbamoyladenosine biosynthesis protein TsaE